MAKYRTKSKPAKGKTNLQDAKEEKKFFKVVGISVVILLLLLFLMFRGFN